MTRLLEKFKGIDVQPQVKTLTLTAAQIRALNATPIALLAALGTGKYAQIERIVGLSTFGVAAFTGANALEIREVNGSGTKVATDMPATGFINIASATAIFDSIPIGAIRLPNVALVVAVPTADPGGGTATGTIKLTIYYRVVTP